MEKWRFELLIYRWCGLWRRFGLRKRHQDNRHRNPADLTMQVEQHAAPGSKAGGRPPPRLRANANPFSHRLPEELHRQVRVRVGHDVLEWPRNAMCPVGRSKNHGERAGVVDDLMTEPEPGDVIALARFHGVHEPGPAMRRLPGAQRKAGRVRRLARLIGKPRYLDRA